MVRVDPNDIVGRRFGNLTVKAFLRCVVVPYTSRKTRKYLYRCLCDCGKWKIVPRNLLLPPTKTGSCGCQWHPLGSTNQRWAGHGEISGTHWIAIVQGAEQRDLPFEITIEEAWTKFIAQDSRCALTGGLLTFGEGVRDPGRTASLDRIDSSKGYVVGNVQWVSKLINRMKWDLREDEFIALCRAVADHAAIMQVAAE
jgi:hypothetical protein